MKRALIIAAAGRSSRFCQSLGRDVLKVLYHEGNEEDCLLNRQLIKGLALGFDHIVIVGGYAFDKLSDFVSRRFSGESQIEVVHNEYFLTYGTCFSFSRGLDALKGRQIDEIVLMEGDLEFDNQTFEEIVSSKTDVVSANSDPIRAERSVVFFVTLDRKLGFKYDPEHKALHIDQPFTAIGNSGQVWKFCDVPLLMRTTEGLGAGLYDDTNLLIVERYFNALARPDFSIITFRDWHNCNTVQDYRRIIGTAKG